MWSRQGIYVCMAARSRISSVTYTVEKDAYEENKGAIKTGWFLKKGECEAGFLGPGRTVWGRGHSGHLVRKGSGAGSTGGKRKAWETGNGGTCFDTRCLPRRGWVPGLRKRFRNEAVFLEPIKRCMIRT